MIYTILPEKDTYITNRDIEGFSCSFSNVGASSTLDIFKINNENVNLKSWAVLEIEENLPLNNETFTLTDTSDNSITFKFVENEDNNNPGINVVDEDNIKIGLGVTPYSSSELVSQISNIINNVSTVIQTGPSGNLELGITSYSSNKTIILEQKTSGEKGDKEISQSAFPNLVVKNSFNRLEYSNLLIKFDLDDFKDKNINNFSNSVFSNKELFKAELNLTDVSLGQSKPQDYTLIAFPLSKSFDEGLGKDTIYFKDLDQSNFVTASYDKTTNTYSLWGIKNFLVKDVDFIQENNNTTLTSSFYVKKGDENITFDITEYVYQVFNNQILDKGLSIRLSDSSLFDSYSYFVKRLGSKHLLNKKLSPQLNIKVNDTSYYLPKLNKNIKYYYDSSNDFYLYNKQNEILTDIATPVGLSNNHFSASLSYKEFELIKKGLGSAGEIQKYFNIFGTEKNGIYKFSTQTSDVSRFSEFLSHSIESSTSGSIEFDLEWYWFNPDFFEGKKIIKKEKIKYLLPENNDFSSKHILSKVTINNNYLIANDTIQSISVFFVNTKRQYKSNKKPYDIECENLGNVYIRLIDTYDEKIILDYDNTTNSTRLFFNGIDYDYNLFIPRSYKGKTISFEFIVEDPVTEEKKIIKSDIKVKVL